jgi:hypothetical protein
VTTLGTNLLDKRVARAVGLSPSTLAFIRGEVKENGHPRVYKKSRHEDMLELERKALEKSK